jgi:hypothetical protein
MRTVVPGLTLTVSMPTQNAAAYLSSYFVKGRRGKTALWESVRSSAMPKSIIYVATALTLETGCTMRTVRLKRALFVWWGVSLPWEEVRAVAALLKAFPGVAQGQADRAPPTAT